MRQGFSNLVRVLGINNHTINIIHANGRSSSPLAPHIYWNTAPQAGGGHAAQLEWRSRLTELLGRDSELQALLDWANGPETLSIKVIEAAGGVGKTRLAAETADVLNHQRKTPWRAGFVRLIDFNQSDRLQWRGHSLIIVDYPEHAPTQLAALLRAALDGLSQAGKKDKLRLLLLCREQQWISQTLGEAGVRGYVSDALRLPDLSESTGFPLLQTALSQLSPTCPPTIDASEFANWQAQSPLHRTPFWCWRWRSTSPTCLHPAHASCRGPSCCLTSSTAKQSAGATLKLGKACPLAPWPT